MDNEALYWILSTIPQVSAALVAFIGFLALYALAEPSRRKAEVETSARKFIGDTRSNPAMGVNIFTTPPYHRLEVVSGSQLMQKVESFLNEPCSQGTSGVELQNYLGTWRELESRIRRVNRLLAGFVAWHLFLILASLALLSNVSLLASVSGLSVAIIIVALGMVISVGIMVYEALSPRA